MNVLYVCLAITLFQGIQGFGGVGYQFMDEELVFSPHNSELMAAETQLIGDNEHCDNVSATLKEIYNLGVNFTTWARKECGTLFNDAGAFYGCSGSGVVSCIINAFKKIKEDILNLKPEFIEYVKQFKVLFLQVKKELPLCLR